jgi:hypothetical protein
MWWSWVVVSFAYVPQDCLWVERCGVVEVNHIATVTPQPWGMPPAVSVQSYWLGRRDINQCDDVWVVDWWEHYHNERVWLTPTGVMVGIRDKRTNVLVIVEARSYRQTWTDYDIEVEQRREVLERWGVNADEYRRGFGRGRLR